MPGPDPAVAAVRSSVRRALADLSPGDLVLVACSGGRDSLALAAGVAFVAPRARLRAGAVVVDHGWTDSSPEVAASAARACSTLGLDPVEVVRVNPTGPGGPEAAARIARYRALGDVAVRRSASAVLLGHTLDDQAETVLLGLARGSGARSLAGMPARRGLLRRPLLQLSREVTSRACACADLAYWDDPANLDPSFTRVRVRQAMGELAATLGPGLPEALARTAEQLREDADALDGLAAAALRAAGGGDRGLDVEVLAAQPDAVRRRVLLAAARHAGSPAGALGRRHVLAADALVVRWRGQGPVHLPGGVIATRACGRLVLDRPPSTESADLTQE